MSYNRYGKSNIVVNDDPLYKEMRDDRDVKQVRQYASPRFYSLTREDLNSLDTVNHVWTKGDRLYKLAYKYYGDSNLWWVIAWYNKRPTDAHYNIGDKVFIPKPLEKILRNFRV